MEWVGAAVEVDICFRTGEEAQWIPEEVRDEGLVELEFGHDEDDVVPGIGLVE